MTLTFTFVQSVKFEGSENVISYCQIACTYLPGTCPPYDKIYSRVRLLMVMKKDLCGLPTTRPLIFLVKWTHHFVMSSKCEIYAEQSHMKI